MKKKLVAIGVIGLIVLTVVFVLIIRGRQTTELRIGAILPLTGQSAQYGKWIRDAIELASEEINQSGGINGKKLLIKYKDDQADPMAAAAAMQELASVDKVPIVFGSWASDSVLAQAPIAEETHTPIMVEAQSPKISTAGDYVFRIRPDSQYYLKLLVPYAYNTLGIRTVSILYIKNDSGLGQAKVFSDSFQQLGGKVLSSEGFQQGSVDFRAKLATIKPLKPDAVFIPSYIEAGNILKDALDMGIKTQFVASSTIENPEVLEIAGPGAEGVIYPYHFDAESDDPKVKEFIQKYSSRFGRQPEGFAALAYDGIYAIASVLKDCNEDKECIKTNLYHVNLLGVTGMTRFDDNGDAIKPLILRMIKNGRFTTIRQKR